MLRKFGIIAVLSLLAVAFAAVPALATGDAVFDPTAAPTGTHVQTGTPTCSFNNTGGVTCSSYELAGVGNRNATATLETTYTAKVNCRNNGGKIVAVKTGTFDSTSTTDRLSPKNGKLTVPSLSSSAPSASKFISQQTCPNPNWTPELGSAITLKSSVYTLVFAREGGDAYITIVDP